MKKCFRVSYSIHPEGRIGQCFGSLWPLVCKFYYSCEKEEYGINAYNLSRYNKIFIDVNKW